MKKVLAGMCALFSSFCVNASGLDLALSNETASLSLLLNPPYQFSDGGGSELAIGGFISEQGDRLGHIRLMARGYRYSNGTSYSLGTGMKAVGGDVVAPATANAPEAEEAVGAVALGFQFGLLLVSSQNNPVEFSVEAFHAPSITSFSDAERYTEIGGRLQVDVIPQARAFIGYRSMRFDTDDYDRLKLDRSVHIGVNLSF